LDFLLTVRNPEQSSLMVCNGSDIEVIDQDPGMEIFVPKFALYGDPG
jgi:hypothetical protein